MPIPVRNILVPTDFSQHSAHALLYAASLGERYGATIHLVHVMTLHGYEENGTDTFPDLTPFLDLADRAARAKLDAGAVDGGLAEVRVQKALLRGFNAYLPIVEYAERKKVDLVIMATKGRSGLSYLLLGSVAERVIRYAPCPVLIVKQGDRDFVDSATGEVRIGRVAVAYDFSESSQRALRYLVDKFLPYKPEVHLLHVVDADLPQVYADLGITSVLQDNPRLEGRLSDLLNEHGAQAVPKELRLECSVREGKPPIVVGEYAAQKRTDLVVVGAESRLSLAERLVGGMTELIVRYSPCPTLIA